MISSDLICTRLTQVILIICAVSVSVAAQAISPEATEHWNAARQAESAKHFDVAVAEYRKVTALEPTFAFGFVSL